METKKATAAKKPAAKKPSTTKSGTPRKPYTKKPPVEVKPKIEEPIVVKTEDGLVDEKTSRVEFGKFLEKDAKVQFVIPFDPENPADQYWECGFNDLLLRYKRGVVLTLPQYIVDFIIGKLKAYEVEQRKTAEYHGSGKKLTY